MPSKTPPHALRFVPVNTTEMTINKRRLYFHMRTMLSHSHNPIKKKGKVLLPLVPALFSNTVLFHASHQDNESQYTLITMAEHCQPVPEQ